MPTNIEIWRSLISGIVINRINPHGDIGEPGWSVWGEEVPACSRKHNKTYWHGATQYPQLSAVMPTAFITREVYNYLVGHGQLEGIRSKIRGVVENTYAKEISWPGGGTCWTLDPSSIIPGLPEPKITCTPAGSFTSVPSQIAASTKTGFPVLTTTLPVILPITNRCVSTFDKVATASRTIQGVLPVIFSINDIDLATVYPTEKIETPLAWYYAAKIDLATYLPAWKHLLSTATTALTLKARVDEQIIHNCTASGRPVGDAGFKAFSAEVTIPVSVCECDEGETRNPEYCWDWSTINTEICSGGLWTPTGAACPVMPAHGTKGGETTCWDGSVIDTQIFDANVKKWIPTGATCPVMPGPGEVRGATTCWDGSVICAEKFDAVTKTWVPTGATCPVMPGPEELRGLTTCWDGSEVYAEMFNATLMRWVPTGATCPVMPGPGEVRGATTCWDGSVIHAEVFRAGTWVPSGEACPTRLPGRVMEMAAPTIVYEGQPVDVVVQVFCGAALSSGEPATLTVDGVDVRTKNTGAGEVSFRWTATGTGMRKVCVDIPANPICPVAGRLCRTITVSAYVGELAEQIKAEKAAYEEELARLRELRRVARRPVRPGAPGVVMVPPSLAGAIVEIGGVPTTIPEGGIPIVVPPGETVVTIIEEGIRRTIPVEVLPGETVTLPTLPGGI
jgi:hypothetical protein